MLDWNRNLLSFHGVFQEAFHGLGMELEDPLDTLKSQIQFLEMVFHVMRLKSFLRKTGMSFSFLSIGVC